MSKVEQAMGRAIRSEVALGMLSPHTAVEEKRVVFDLETVRSKGVTVVPWDGMWVNLCEDMPRADAVCQIA